MNKQPRPIIRQIGVQHWDHATILHRQNNFPRITFVSLNDSGWIYTLETYNQPKQPFNIYKVIYKVDYSSLNLDYQQRNQADFNQQLKNILSQGNVSPAYKEYIGPVG
tara:strand:- start:291 stop:614 length:324 start_codon:yes stop_codon:yes gene_type:complete